MTKGAAKPFARQCLATKGAAKPFARQCLAMKGAAKPFARQCLARKGVAKPFAQHSWTKLGGVLGCSGAALGGALGSSWVGLGGRRPLLAAFFFSGVAAASYPDILSCSFGVLNGYWTSLGMALGCCGGTHKASQVIYGSRGGEGRRGRRRREGRRSRVSEENKNPA